MQKGQDGIEASLTINLEIQWQKYYKDIVTNHLTAAFPQKTYSLEEQVETASS